MRRVLATTIIAFLHIALGFAQDTNNATILGRIMDTNGKDPLEYTTIQLLQLPDSSLATGSTSNLDGSFEIKNVKAGKYIARISFVGYVTLDKKITITDNTPKIDLGDIKMKTDSEVLSAVTVTGKATPVVMKEDTIEFNSTAFRVADGAMLEELVKKLPGAEINQEGKLLVNGKEIKKILVDGKEFFSNDPKVSLKNLPANMVEKVKTYNKKSENATLTGVDDDEDETVLDLSVKKGMKNGWFGNVLGGLGNKERYEAGAMMNRFSDNSNFSVLAALNNTNNSGFSEFGDTDFGRLGSAGSGITSSQLYGTTFAQNFKKTEFGGNVQFGRSDNDSRKKSSTETFLRNESSFRNDTTNANRKRNDLATNFRVKWSPDSSNTILVLPTLTYSKTDAFSDGISETRNGLHERVNRKESSTLNEGDAFNLNTTFRYIHKFNKRGRSLSTMVRLEYSNNDSETHSTWATHLYIEGDSIISTDRETDRDNHRFTGTGEVTYTEPLNKWHSLQFKVGFQERVSGNNSYAYDLNSDPTTYVDSLSSEVKNTYIRYTAELGLQGKYSKVNYNIGAAILPQSTTSETNVGPNAGKELSQKVVNFSPSIRFRYKFSKKSSLNFNYRGQSSAPNIEYLQNIIDQDDPLNIQYGDPDLKPSFTNNIRLRFNEYDSEKQFSFTANIGFSNTLNSVTNKMIYNTTTGGKETYKVNVDGNWNTNAYLTTTFPILYRKINVSNSLNGNYAERVSFASTASQDSSKAFISQECTTQSFTLNDKLSLSYRIENFDISGNAAIAYQTAYNEIQRNSNRETFNYSFGGNANVYLPWSVSISTDANYDLYSGYTDGFGEPKFIWNAQVAKNFLKNNAATIRFKIYDLLQQQTSLTRSVSNTEICDTEYNTLGSYFMVHFVYRINTLGKKASQEARNNGEPNYERMAPNYGDGPRQNENGGRPQSRGEGSNRMR